MSIAFYKPNKSNRGFAASFQNSHQNDCVFATIIKQSSWNEETKIGGFAASREDKSASVTVKLNQVETAAILDCIERGRPYSSFHDGESSKNINFVPWMSKPVNEEDKQVQRGFSFSITIANKEDSSSKNSFYIGFSFAEARLIREFLLNCLNNQFDINREKNSRQKDSSIVNEQPKNSKAEVLDSNDLDIM
jgi:hypothetical protein